MIVSVFGYVGKLVERGFIVAFALTCLSELVTVIKLAGAGKQCA